jgi:hypothetical protein
MPVVITPKSPTVLVPAKGCPDDPTFSLPDPVTSASPLTVTMTVQPTFPTKSVTAKKAPMVTTLWVPGGTTPASVSSSYSGTTLTFKLGNVGSGAEKATYLHRVVVTATGDDGATASFTFYYYFSG